MSNKPEELIARCALARATQLTYTNDIVAKNINTEEEVSLNELNPKCLYRIEFSDAEYRVPSQDFIPCTEGSCLIYGAQVQRVGNIGIVCELPNFTITNINCLSDYDRISQEEGHTIDFPNDNLLPFSEKMYTLNPSNTPLAQYEDIDEIKREEKSAKKDKRAQMFYVSKGAKEALVEKYITMEDMIVACRSSDAIKNMFWTVDANGLLQQINVANLESGDSVLFGDPNSIYGTPDLIEDVVTDIMIDEKHRIYLIELGSGIALSSIDFEKELAQAIKELESQEIAQDDRIIN